MRLQFIFLLIPVIMLTGCSEAISENRMNAAGPVLPELNSNSGTEYFYLDACVPSNVVGAWENAYTYTEGKEYNALDWSGTPGDVIVERGSFGTKEFLNTPFPYQYGLYLNFDRVNGAIIPRIMVVWSEPIGNLSRRLLSDGDYSDYQASERYPQLVPSNVNSANKVWIGVSETIRPGHTRPTLYFVPDDSPVNQCEISWTRYQDTFPNVKGADLRQIDLIYGKFWALSYNAVNDTISGKLVLQLEYMGEPFLQIWSVVLERNS